MPEPAGESPPRRFDYGGIPTGYYDEVMRTGHPVRRCWHRQKFERVIAALPGGEGRSILDIGCFAGTFLSLLPPEQFARQLGVDILPAQIRWAAEHHGTPFREFRAISSLEDLVLLGESFDCITLIEVIEHLDAGEIRRLLGHVAELLTPGGQFVITTPNYASAWPLVELALNRLSDVKYEEQHLSRFRFRSFDRRLRALAPEFDAAMELELKTTSHFLSPFLAVVSERLAMRASRVRDPERWHLPFGNLILARYRKRRQLPVL